MYNRQHLKSYNISKLGVIVLSIVLLTGISIIPTLQIEVQGRGQPQRTTTPAISPTPTTPATSTATTASTTPKPVPAPPTGTASLRQTPTTPALDAVGGAVNQSAMVMIPRSSVMTMMSNLQTDYECSR